MIARRCTLAWPLVLILPAALAVAQAAVAPAIRLTPATAQLGTLVPGAQPVVVEAAGDAAPADGASVTENADADGQANADPQAERKQQRRAAIEALQFDRRPSTILRSWSGQTQTSTPEPEAPAEATPDSTPKPEPTEAEREQAALTAHLNALQSAVTLGNWPEVKSRLADREQLSAEEADQAYLRILVGLAQTAPVDFSHLPGIPESQRELLQNLTNNMRANSGQRYAEHNTIAIQDLVGLIEAAPSELKAPTLTRLAPLVRVALNDGNVIDELLLELRRQGDALLTRRQAALLLSAAGRDAELGEFLSTADEAIRANDRETLNLLARHYLALHQSEKKDALLESAWRVTLAALAAGDITSEQKEEALQRTVSLASRIRDELGAAWLQESFTTRVERGQEILATIGSTAAQRLATSPHDATGRLQGLKLQASSVKALVDAAPELAREWRHTLNLLADNWLREADVSQQFSESNQYGPQIQRDMYGNIFYVDEEAGYGNFNNRNGNRPAPIAVRDVLETRPEGLWFELVDEGLKPRFYMLFCQLLLKVNDDAEAFPYIERLASTYPDKAHDLAEEFLRVWTRNHNPNDRQQRTNYYMFMYGFDMRADRIPLTRSKQERNLVELSDWITRLRQLPIAELDESLLVEAFTTCHSAAEVYRMEAIESVFGSWEEIAPETIASLIQRMRSNLSSTWQEPAVQQQNNTKRKKADIQAEVAHGYRVATEVLERALGEHPESWQLTLAKATLLHDVNDYEQSLNPSSEYSARREVAFQTFADAAARYASVVSELDEDEQSTDVLDHWFYAALGASDLRRVNQDTVPDLRQIPKIADALNSLPGEAAGRHRDRFANALFTRMSAVNPACKMRYLSGGFEIVGDHPQAHEARKVFDYYHDLVTEIKLDTVLDGSNTVGHGEPFGIYVNLRHTKEIERESGGFGKYLQNQNNMYYAYNYGRPTENYRDKFQEAATKILQEQFEVLSITFNHPETQSKSIEPYGWRVTPYAYVLLKSRGPEVDKIPSLRLDLDFLDTSGYVVLPIESPAIPVDSLPTAPGDRPFRNLKLVQTLDERQAADGKLLLEIKATAEGLVPPLDQLLDLDAEGFEHVKSTDQGVSIEEFSQEAADTTILSERMWTVEYRADDTAAPPEQFTYPAAFIEPVEITRQRYVDADLEEVESTVPLVQRYAVPSRTWLWLTLLAIGLVASIIAGAVVLGKRKAITQETRLYELPERITPFTVIGLLKQLHLNNGLSREKQQELDVCIQQLERHYFLEPELTDVDLESIARQWLSQADRTRTTQPA